jgi:hypothetical protein
MPFVNVSDNVNTALENIRIFVKNNTGMLFTRGQILDALIFHAIHNADIGDVTDSLMADLQRQAYQEKV